MDLHLLVAEALDYCWNEGTWRAENLRDRSDFEIAMMLTEEHDKLGEVDPGRLVGHIHEWRRKRKQNASTFRD